MGRRSALLVLLLIGCSGGPPPARTRPPPLVAVQPVALEDVPVLVRGPIDIRPIAQADIGAKSVGYLDAVLVDRGDTVKKGQLLALVRPSDLPDQLVAAKSAVAQAEASRALAKANLARAEALAPRGLVSQQELQNTMSAAAGAEAQVGASQANLAALGTRLGETRLEAPYDGVVTARRLDPGALVGPTSGPVLTVAKVDTVRAFVSVLERQAAEVALGQPARIRVDALKGEVFTGRVERLAPTFDPVTRTLDAEVHFQNEKRELRPGMYGRAEIEVGLHHSMPVVPVEALQISEEHAWGFVLEGDTARRRDVKLGEDLGSRVEVLSGLKQGELLIVRGIDGLSDGAKVRVAPRPDAGSLTPVGAR